MKARCKLNTPKLILVIVCLIIAIGLAGYFVWSTYNFVRLIISDFQSTPRIFGDISECEKIYDFDYTDVTIVRYEDASRDERLGDLKYKEFFGAQYSSSEADFEIFAYVFESEDDASEYWSNTSSGFIENLRRGISHKSLLNMTHRTIKDNKVYVIYVQGFTHPGEIINSVNEIFTDEVFSDSD